MLELFWLQVVVPALRCYCSGLHSIMYVVYEVVKSQNAVMHQAQRKLFQLRRKLPTIRHKISWIATTLKWALHER